MTSRGPRKARPGSWDPRRAAAPWATVLTAFALLGCLTVQQASAQQSGSGEARRQAQADSARAKVLERLQRLDRPPVADSMVSIADSLVQMGDTVSIPPELRPRELPGGSQPRRLLPAPDEVTSENIEIFLKSLPGYTLTEYESRGAEFDADNRRLTLRAGEGTSEIRQEGMVLRADSTITYDEGGGILRAVGDSVVMTPPDGGDPVSSSGLVYDLNEGRGSAVGATTQYREGGNWKIYGDLPYLAENTAFASHARFTSCEETEPHYHFETDELKIVGDGVLVARPVRLYFADVPVAWLPFVAQSLSDGRASGILTPRFSVNDIARTSSGYDRRISNVGFYWAINDYMDGLLAGDWFSNNYAALTGAYRYAWREKFVQGNLNFRRFWRAEGGRELALDSRHSWEPNERTQVRLSARYASSVDFVRQNTFDPREVTQSIDSEGGANRRFDWGTMAVSANRRQYLSDDRVEMTLPQVTLSLQPVTIFGAPGTSARWFNNWTWAGSTNMSRRTIDRPELPDSVASISTGLFDQVTTQAGVNSSFNLGAVSWSQTLQFQEGVVKDFPVFPDTLIPISGEMFPEPSLSRAMAAGLFDGADIQDLSRATVQWSTSVGYQQRLVGTTTLTPRLSMSGSLLKDDQIAAASQNFVSAPSRLSFGASLKTDFYGFWPGFSRYSAVRHKFSPTFDYEYAPPSTPTELQQEVFNVRDLQARNQLRISLNQTFEAKVEAPEDSASAAGAAAPTDGGPRRLAQAQIVNLLALRTSAVTYDFQQADSLGDWTRGFAESLTLSNSISSDFLRGLTLSVQHDIFDSSPLEDVEGPLDFSPHLSRMNLSFSVGSRSGFFLWLSRITGGTGDPEGVLRPEDEEAARLAEEEGLLDPVMNPDDSMVMPGVGNSSFAGSTSATRQSGRTSGSVGTWNANFSYSLVRPRNEGLQPQQMIQSNIRFKPTERWDLVWQTSYDLERGGFNDHILRLTRDLHRWQAAFDFRQTATGNWSFRFEVSLLDNRDLKFDYKQDDLVDLSR